MQQGFGRFITGSLAVHLAFITAGVLLYDAGVKRGITIPPYSVVSLVEGPAKAPVPSRSMPSSSAGEVKNSAHVEPAREVEKKKTVNGKNVRVKGKAKGKTSDAAVSEALKKIALKVRKKERKAVVAEGIEALRKKREAQAHRPAPSNGVQEAKGRPAGKSAGATRGGTGIGAAGPVSQEGLKERYPAYYSLIRDRVQSRWIYPEEFKETRILVTVSIKIGKDGGLMETKLEGSSGNELFDESLLSAVKKSAPFPPLPHGFEADYLEAVLRFCSSCGD